MAACAPCVSYRCCEPPGAGAGNWTPPGASGRAVRALNHWAIPTAPHPPFPETGSQSPSCLEHLLFLLCSPVLGYSCTRQVSPLDPWCSLTRFTGQCNPWSCSRALPSSQDDPFVPICGACLFLPLKVLNLGFRILVPFPWNRKESLKLESLLSNMVNRIIALFGFLFVILGIEPSQGLSHTRQSSITAISPDLIFWFKNVV